MKPTPDPNASCVICGRADVPKRAIVEDPFFPGVYWHILCINSAEGRQWRAELEEKNPGYRRWIVLSSHGVRVSCPKCGSDKSFLWPKLRGHSPTLEASCDRCERVNYNALDPYSHKEVVSRIQLIARQFHLGTHPDNLDALIGDLADEYDRLILPRQCQCGGYFSLSAKPRCRNCKAILYDSYFHFSGKAQKKTAIAPELRR